MMEACPETLRRLTAPLLAPGRPRVEGTGQMHTEAKLFLQCGGRTRFLFASDHAADTTGGADSLVLEPGQWLLVPRFQVHAEQRLGPQCDYELQVLVLQHRPMRLLRVRRRGGQAGIVRAWLHDSDTWRASLIRLCDEYQLSVTGQRPRSYRRRCLRLLQEALALCVDGFSDGRYRTPPVVLRATAQVRLQFADPELRLQTIADALGVSGEHLARSFKASRGQSLGNHILAYRLNVAQHLLSDTRASIASIATQVGFRSHGYFCRRFRETFGMTPGSFRRRCR